MLCCSVYAGFAFPEQWHFTRRRTASLLRSKGCGFAMSKKLSKMNTCGTSLKEVWECSIISKTSKCVSDTTLSNYHHHLRGIGKHLDIEMPLPGIGRRWISACSVVGVHLGSTTISFTPWLTLLMNPPPAVTELLYSKFTPHMQSTLHLAISGMRKNTL